MNKKDLKFYEAPVFEEFELKVQGILCASDGKEESSVPGITTEEPGTEY